MDSLPSSRAVTTNINSTNSNSTNSNSTNSNSTNSNSSNSNSTNSNSANSNSTNSNSANNNTRYVNNNINSNDSINSVNNSADNSTHNSINNSSSNINNSGSSYHSTGTFSVEDSYQSKDVDALSSLLMLAQAKNHVGAVKTENSTRATENTVTSINSVIIDSSPDEDSRRDKDNEPIASIATIGVGAYAIEDLRKYFHLPIADAAKLLSTCTTALKKFCRKNNINKWPYRQIRSITKSIESLEMASLNPDLTSDVRIQYRNQILYLRNAIDELIKDPNKVVKLNGFIPNMSVGIGGDSISMEYDRNGYDNEEDLALPRPSAEVEEILRAAKNTIVDPKRKPKRSFDSVTGTENDPDSKVNHSSSETNSVNSKGTDRRGIAGGCSFRNLPDVGLTTVNIDGQSENPKYFYCQPVYLAPLQRKKISQNVSGKVVPLMEPDIGSHFFIEFVPIFVSNSLDRSLKALPHGNHYNGPYSDGVLPDIDI